MIAFRLSALFLLLFLVLPATAQDSTFYSRLNTYSVFTEYSNTSSHIILGVAQNRRLIAPGIAYSRRLLHTRYADWNYAIEVRPLTFIQQPYLDSTYTAIPPATGTIYPAQSGPVARNCNSGSSLSLPISVSGFPTIPGYIYTYTCSRPWTYAGGVSPLGQRISIAPRNRLQLFLVGNAGFLAATQDIPSNDSRRFNFTFEFGAGLEFFQNHSRSWSAEYRIHHLSNAYTARNNPGIDNQILKLTYSFGR